MAEPPSIIDGPKLEVKRVTEFHMPCPKCSKDIRVTEIEAGSVIKCPHPKCNNVTWRPEYVLPWWAKTWKFVGSVIASFSLGFLSSLAATAYAERHSKGSNPIPKTDPVLQPVTK